jgi:tripartite-type tricarboxylate transporter receptor subunit TctC
LSRVASVANVLAVHSSLGIGSVRDLVYLAKTRPGQLNFGSSGNGTLSHLAGEMFNVLAGVKTVHVAYKGTPAALNDLVAKQLQFIISAPPSVMPHARAGRIKLLATTGVKRDPLLPELPSVAETISGFESTLWWGIALPAKPPVAVIVRLHAEIMELQTPVVRELLAKQGAMANAESTAQFAAFIQAERERFRRIGHQVGVTLE